MASQVAQARNMSIGEHRHCCVTLISKYKDLYGEKTYRFRNLRKWKDFNKKPSLNYIKCVLRLSWVVHGPMYGVFMGCFLYREKTVYSTTH